MRHNENVDRICELAAIVLLAMASVYDLRERTIPDRLWVIGSALGITMKLLNHDQTIQFISKAWPFLLILLIMLATEWLLSLSGQADVLAYLTLTTLLSGNCMFPDAFLTYLLSKILIALIIPFQFLINIVKISRDHKLIEGFDEPLWRKVLALMVLSPYDERLAKFASPAEANVDGKRKFVLRAALSISQNDSLREGSWIAPAYPAMPFILAATVTTITIPQLLLH